MKETLQDLCARRSMRSFKKEQVSEELLEQVLKAGTYAPTGMGKQSPIIVVVQDPDTVAQLSRMNAAVMGGGRGDDPFYGAPTVIIVLADRSVAGTWQEDGALVMGNLLNAAYAVGLGACWVHRARQEFESEEGKALLKKWGIEGDYVGVGHCILGYPDGEPAPARPRKEGYVIRV